MSHTNPGNKSRLVNVSVAIRKIMNELRERKVKTSDRWELLCYYEVNNWSGSDIIYYNSCLILIGYPTYDTMFTLLSGLDPDIVFQVSEGCFRIVIKYSFYDK